MSWLLWKLLPVLATAAPTPVPAPTPPITGEWVFFEKVFQGQEMPEPADAPLHMHFSFSASGESHLWWWHDGAGDHCSRKGKYHAENGLLHDEVTWVDPKNTSECADDMDMQLGRSTTTPFYFRNGALAIRFQFGDDELDMVWKRISEE